MGAGCPLSSSDCVKAVWRVGGAHLLVVNMMEFRVLGFVEFRV